MASGTAPSNWNRWGPEDQRGTLNLITPERRRAALGSVRSGRTVSCARDLVPGLMPYARGATAVEFDMVRSGADAPPDAAAGASEHLGMVFHGRYVTHLDSLAHVFDRGRLYNEVDAREVSPAGTRTHAVTVASEGIVTRGVLLDAARHRGVTELADGTPVEADELDAIARAQGVTPRPGDAVLLRTGHGARVAAWRPGDAPLTGYAGWAPSCLPWLHRHDAAVAGADTAQDPLPAPADVRYELHVTGIVRLGLWLLDNCDLEELAAACESERRWDFLFVIAPLRLAGGTGSPVNPIAIF
jgi:kynurenine formamidase